MTRDTLQDVLRSMLPVANVHPGAMPQLASFLRWAETTGDPAVRALDSPERTIVVLGQIAGAPEAVAEAAARSALQAVPEAARRICRSLIVCWQAADGTAHGAVYEPHRGDWTAHPLAVSWEPQSAWAWNGVDLDLTPEENVRAALSAIRSAMESCDADGPELFERPLARLNYALRYCGSEGSHAPPASSPARSIWFEDLSHSVEDELKRLAAGVGGGAIPFARDPSGPLAGLRVFLSYARPDAVSLARPACRALAGLGASVWFDQTERVDGIQLDAGFDGVIGECDAFVFCASAEYFERAGYATQELAWAVHEIGRAERLSRVAVVADGEVMLPAVVRDWPCADVAAGGETFTAALAGALGQSAAIPVLPARAAPAAPVADLPAEVDLAAIRQRRRHVERFLEISIDDLTALLASDDRSDATRERLAELGDGLDWDGRLTSYGTWPSDPLVRDCRLYLGCARVIGGLRWPLSGDLECPDGIAGDLDWIARGPLPIHDWPTGVGWSENERRLSLRRYCSQLRVVSEAIRRRICASLYAEHLSEAQMDAILAALAGRRQEALDALLALRLGGSLSWLGEPPTWDRLHAALKPIVATSHRLDWDVPVDDEALSILSCGLRDVPAVLTDVLWCSLIGGENTAQRLKIQHWSGPVLLLAWASHDGARPDPGECRLAIGVDMTEKPAVVLASQITPDRSPRTSSCAAPDLLAQALKRSSNLRSS